jgi:hypothetical protein
VLLGHILNPEIAVFCQEKRNNSVFKKHGLKMAFFATKFRLSYQKRANPGHYRAPLGSVTLVSVIRILTYCPVSLWKVYRKNEGIIRAAMVFPVGDGGYLMSGCRGCFGGNSPAPLKSIVLKKEKKNSRLSSFPCILFRWRMFAELVKGHG